MGMVNRRREWVISMDVTSSRSRCGWEKIYTFPHITSPTPLVSTLLAASPHPYFLFISISNFLFS